MFLKQYIPENKCLVLNSENWQLKLSTLPVVEIWHAATATEASLSERNYYCSVLLIQLLGSKSIECFQNTTKVIPISTAEDG